MQYLATRDNLERPAKHLILTFSSAVLPTFIKAGCLNFTVKPYIPNPRRCFRCQRYGRGSLSCRGKATCARCGSTDHAAENCSSDTAKCVNCGGPHPTYSRTCPLWKQEKDVIALKTKENISFPEARRRLSFLQRGTFSEAVRRGPSLSSVSVETRVCPQDLNHAHRAPKQKKATSASLPSKGTRVAPIPQQPEEAAPSPSTEKEMMETSPSLPECSPCLGECSTLSRNGQPKLKITREKPPKPPSGEQG